MAIAITLVSIYALTLLAAGAKKLLKINVCPPCVGVAATWIWILIGLFAGFLEAEDWNLIAAILMGGSVVGISFQIEKYLPASASPVLWKSLFVPLGFTAAFSVFAEWWIVVIASLIFLIILSAIFLKLPHNNGNHSKKIHELEAKLKSCC